MKIEFTREAAEQYKYWKDNDESKVERIKELIKDIQQTPFKGLGKPEPLKFSLKGFWSRRISEEHRLVYKVDGKKGVDQTCTIIQCRFHYDN